jgi:SAM-dependent methyltransferase
VSGFDARWLALREPADHRSRSATLVSSLRSWLDSRAVPARLVDLGCGTGSDIRYLAPRLGGAQRWVGIDDDDALLRELGRSTLGGAASGAGDLREVVVETRRANLALGSSAFADLAPHAFVASALLDLVSHEWLQALVARARAGGAAVLFALSYDGRIEAWPAHAGDATVRATFNEHQRRDKGFGPALGPRACEAIAEILAAAGYAVCRQRTDWALDASRQDDASLILPLIDGIAAAAREQVPAESGRIDAWLAARRAQCLAGALRITVGHEDTLGLPGSQ